MELRDGREKRNDRSGNRTPTALFEYKRIGSYTYDRIHSGICRTEARKSNSTRTGEWNSSVQDFESSQWNRHICRNGDVGNPRTCCKKYNVAICFCLDKYIAQIYINPHNTPTKNKKARRQPGSELDKSPTTDLCLSPLLFAVNQKI